MRVLLVRHAKAGSRRNWDGPDDLRPLSAKGRRQAERLVTLIGHEPITAVLSSPYLRCVDTVTPLAEKLGLAVDGADALAEGAPVAATLELIDGLVGPAAVLCSHGDVIPAVLEALARTHGLPLPAGYDVAKASTWLLEAEAGRFVAARYLPPPD